MGGAVGHRGKADAVGAPGIARFIWQAAQAHGGQRGVVAQVQGKSDVKGGPRGLAAARQVRGDVDVACTGAHRQAQHVGEAPRWGYSRAFGPPACPDLLRMFQLPIARSAAHSPSKQPDSKTKLHHSPLTTVVLIAPATSGAATASSRRLAPAGTVAELTLVAVSSSEGSA